MDELDKGICRLSLVNMRNEPSYESPISSQILFGEHYCVLEKERAWINIKLHADGETGWIRKEHYESISQEYFDQINNSEYKICTDITGNIFFKKKNVNILLGSILPISTNELFKIEEQVAFNGECKSLHQRREPEYLVEIVKKYVHAPYEPGGRSPFGIDSGALIQQAFKISGYFLKRNLKDQITEGIEINSVNDLTIGDVIYTGKKKAENAWVYFPDSKFVGIKFGSVQIIDSIDREPEIISIRRFIH